MIGAAIFAFVLLTIAGIAKWLMSIGATAQDLRARYADKAKEAEDARKVAEFERVVADAQRGAAVQRERVAALSPTALADDLRMLCSDPFASDPRPKATPPSDAAGEDDGHRRA